MICPDCKNTDISQQIYPQLYQYKCKLCTQMCSCNCGFQNGNIIRFARNYNKHGKTSILKLVKNAIKNGRTVNGLPDICDNFVKNHYPQHLDILEKYLILL